MAFLAIKRLSIFSFSIRANKLLRNIHSRFIMMSTFLALILAGCGEQEKNAPQASIPEVGVVTVAATPVPVFSYLPGRTSPMTVSQVRARVDGIVLKREFIEGQNVEKGQTLFKIDPAPYVVALDNAKAILARAQANLTAQNADVARYRNLLEGNAVSKQTYENAVAAQGQAAADVAAGRSAVALAQINLDHTQVVSPVSGRIGVSEVTEGAFVRASEATLLATVQQLDPIYVDLVQSSSEGLRFRTDILEGRLEVEREGSPKVDLMLETGRAYDEKGELQFSDISVERGTGAVTLRAVFPNKNHLLLPGMFVRARIQEGVNHAAMLVPQTGITHDQSGRPIALVVGNDEKIAQAVLTTAGTHGADWIVTGGVKPGDRVVVQGVQKVRPGVQVTTVAATVPPALTGDAFTLKTASREQ
ncbi:MULTISPECIES: efflux RND transporter periplasmic adaptor subunit [unclassified Pseudomonas]|uniref:efflux RND transporter periplasmic adaptor subunit n=1 Tax=unclassified Pseudomonas TaxID=196821 RepID=UPI0035C1C355